MQFSPVRFDSYSQLSGCHTGEPTVSHPIHAEAAIGKLEIPCAVGMWRRAHLRVSTRSLLGKIRYAIEYTLPDCVCGRQADN